MNPRTATFAVLLLASISCTPPPEASSCTPESCGGCCDANGVCQPGDQMDACGGGGTSCDVCASTQTCDSATASCQGGGVGGGAGGGAGGGSGGGAGGGGGTCTPTTCAAQNKNCGSISDGCGGMLSCGTCGGLQTCGGGGTANVCGQTCLMTCPAGFTCNAEGACAGGMPTNLQLDIKTFTVSGAVTVNGAALMNVGSECTTYPTMTKAVVHFLDLARGYRVEHEIPCNTAGGTFSVALFPGTYEVSVEGKSTYTNLPNARTVIVPSLAVSAAVSNQTLDAKVVSVSGTVTLNGAQPMTKNNCTGSSTKATVIFRDEAKFTDIRVNVPCTAAPFAFDAKLFPGTYSVRVDGDTYYSNLPGTPVLVADGFTVTTAMAGQAFDVKLVSVAGKVTHNGALPMNGSFCQAGYTRVMVQFVDAKKETWSVPVLCEAADYAFTGSIPVGTYEVRIYGYSGVTAVPTDSFQLMTGLVVNAPLNGQVFDVKTQAVTGNVTLNGQTPSDVGNRCANYPSEKKVRVLFLDQAKGYALDIDVPCMSNTYAFTGQLFPGSYEVRVEGSASSNIPSAGFLAGSLNVAGAVPGQVFDVKTVAFTGTLTLNGMTPNDIGTECLTHPTDIKATVELTDKAKGHSITASIPCSSANYAFATPLFPGTWDVRVKGTNRTDLPQAGFQVHAAKAVAGSQNNQVLDVKTVQVGGKVLLNGALPMNQGNNCFMYPNDVKAVVTFKDRAKGYALTTNVLCSSAEFTFAAPMFPGTYEVRVKGTDRSNLPEDDFLAINALAIP